MKESLEIKNEYSEENNNKNIKQGKYKQLFDKYKAEDGLISKNGLNSILKECGIETTINQSEDLIKKINNDNQSEKLNFNKFIELMESESIININEKKSLSNMIILLIFILLIISGVILTITTKILPKLTSLGQLYEGHRQFIIFCMFFGQFICLILYFIKSNLFKKNNDNILRRKHVNNLYFLLLSVLNIIANNLKIFVIAYLLPSIQQMFHGSLIIFTFIASIMYLKSKYYRHHFLSICIIIIGVTITGLNDITNDQSLGESKNIGLGIFLVILTQIIISFYYSLEEKLLKEYDLDPLKLVGIEGILGVIIYIPLLFLFQFISCASWAQFRKDNFCVTNDDYNNHIEDSIFAFNQMSNRKLIFYMTLLYFLGVILYDYSRLIIFKNRSAVFYLIIDNVRRILDYIIVIVVILSTEYKEDSEKFSWIILLGYAMLLL